jgi:O-antigen/teichoic acid export membrane protein
MLRSVAQQLVASLLCAAISFALTLYLGRVLGADDFGRYVALLSIAVVMLPLIEGGWPPLLYRGAVTAEHPSGESHAPAQAMAHALGAGAVLTTIALFVAEPSSRMVVPGLVAAIGCMTLVALTNQVSARMRGQGEFWREAVWRVVVRSITALAIVAALIALGTSVAAIFLAWAAGLLLALATLGRRWSVRPRWRGLRHAYPTLLPLLAMELFVAVLLKGDVAIAAGAGLEGDELSYYAAGSRVMEAGVLVFAPFVIVLLRSLRLKIDDPPEYRRELRLALLVALGCGMIGLLLGAWQGSVAMPLLFGPEFAAAGALLPWLLASLAPIFATLVLMQGIVALGRERRLPPRLAVVALAIVAAIAVGVELDGARGAAIGLCCGQVLLVFLLAPLSRAASA